MNILWHYFRSLESSVLHHPHQIFPFSPLSLSASCHAIFYARLSILLRNANTFRLSSPREVILLEREDRSQLFCSESYFSCKRKHWRMKVLFPENDRSQTQFTRNRVSRGKLIKVAKLFAFYFRGSISFPSNNNRWNATRCNNTISLPFLLFVLSAKRHFFFAEFIRVANHVNRNKERGQEVRGKNPLELPPRINGGEALSRWRRRNHSPPSYYSLPFQGRAWLHAYREIRARWW